jgi:oxalate decarboxylase
MTVFFPVINARTLGYKANDAGYVPSNAGHYFENKGDTDRVVLELFASDEFLDVSFTRWLRRAPCEMLDAHLNIDKAMAQKIPAEKLYLV